MPKFNHVLVGQNDTPLEKLILLTSYVTYKSQMDWYLIFGTKAKPLTEKIWKKEISTNQPPPTLPPLVLPLRATRGIL